VVWRAHLPDTPVTFSEGATLLQVRLGTVPTPASFLGLSTTPILHFITIQGPPETCNLHATCSKRRPTYSGLAFLRLGISELPPLPIYHSRRGELQSDLSTTIPASCRNTKPGRPNDKAIILP
jgi:hypothetical protein